MTHILDRPAWNALTSTHAALAQGSPLAKRYPSSIVPFAAMQKNTPECLEALASLPTGSEQLALVEAEPIATPASFDILIDAMLLQLVAAEPFEPIMDPRIQPLAEADAADMLALATLTKPGPFTLGAQKLGKFWGIRIDGQLVAMGGQRMRQPGFAELSGLCTHPDFQGKGLGKTMLRYVAGEISAGGETVYLHAYSHNAAAVSLYKRMGFSPRRELHFRVIKRENQA